MFKRGDFQSVRIGGLVHIRIWLVVSFKRWGVAVVRRTK